MDNAMMLIFMHKMRDTLIEGLKPEDIPKLKQLQEWILEAESKIDRVTYSPKDNAKAEMSVSNLGGGYRECKTWRDKIVYTLSFLGQPSTKAEIYEFIRSKEKASDISDKALSDKIAHQLWLLSKGKNGHKVIAVETTPGKHQNKYSYKNNSHLETDG